MLLIITLGVKDGFPSLGSNLEQILVRCTHRKNEREREGEERDLLCPISFKTWDQNNLLVSFLGTNALSVASMKFISKLMKETSFFFNIITRLSYSPFQI